MQDCKAIFTDIYARKVWGEGSGGGSDPDQARPYCDFVSHYLATLKGRGITGTVLDIGCGDGVVANGIDFTGWEYIGVDAAQGFDALTDPIPECAVMLCKEVLQHLSNAQVSLLLERTAHIPLRLFTNTIHDSLPMNTDIETGDCRAVDLSRSPFDQRCRTELWYGHWHVQSLIAYP